MYTLPSPSMKAVIHRCAALVWLFAVFATGCSALGSEKTDTEQEADKIAAAVGKDSYCYFIGSLRYRAERRGLYQCEAGTTNAVPDCYVWDRDKPVQVNKLLHKEAFKSLEESDVARVACVAQSGAR